MIDAYHGRQIHKGRAKTEVNTTFNIIFLVGAGKGTIFTRTVALTTCLRQLRT